MTEREDFIVAEPYKPTEEENLAIKELEDKGLVADDWDSGKKHIKSFKNSLRHFMYRRQKGLCAFCRMNAPLSCVHLHREHIVYKDEHPQWMFLPENLCVSCPVCNEFKGTDEVLKNPNTKTYPKSGDGFKIIHPLYDRYSEHIELIGGILYHGKTEKGVFTINTCHLYRVGLAEDRADNRMYEENKGNIVAELIRLAKMPELYVDDKEEFLQYIQDIVMEYKNSQSQNIKE